ncbi:hypothetical protein A0H81_11993 [Grifola frondosa]|uniref:Uncharacterized protein n=1 Tax=Grifola frondosa TaxID=5627 RepID=A0A1C7LT71_GRIFR|nr:hypothetical protein A0H81_11993 [Grifola frondosa]
MRPSSLLPRLQDVQSPCLDVLSPPIDAGDASSDDGDTLQTPLTEHDEHRPHSYGVYNQHKHHITQDPFHSYGPAERADDFVDPAKLNFTSAAAYSLLSPPLPSSVSENHHGALFSTPTRALDLANASLEINQFSGFSNYSLDPSASPFTPTNQSLETASPLFAPSPEPKYRHLSCSSTFSSFAVLRQPLWFG